VVLDEADEMLDMGFAEDIELILEAAPAERQTALFSATLPPRIAAIADKHLRAPVRVQIAREKPAGGAQPRVRQTAYVVQRAHKVAALGRVLDLEAPSLAIVFARTRTEVDEVAEKLRGRGFAVEALHGGLSQDQRDRVMKRVRGGGKAGKSGIGSDPGSVDLLVATDVAARGLDVEHLTHVINFNVPASPESYVHRIGRTGRAGRAGVAITLAEPREHRLLRNIEQLTRQKIEVATLPTAMDVRARRLDMTRAALRTALEAGALDGYRVVTEELAGEFDPLDVAAAAVKLAHEALQGPAAASDDEHIPSLPAPRVPGGKGGKGGKTHETPAAGHGAAPPAGRHKTSKPQRGGAMVRLWVSLGRQAGLRAADLVGAIANEAGISAREIGGIEIEDRFSLVEVSDEVAEQAVRALRAASLRGQRVVVRRDVPGAGARRDPVPHRHQKVGPARTNHAAAASPVSRSSRGLRPGQSVKTAKPARP
jgi:ATP-dependent RNA helicase DeaD